MTHYIADVAVFGYMGGLQRPTGAQRDTTTIRGDRAAKIQDFYTMQVLGFEKIREKYLKAVPVFGI